MNLILHTFYTLLRSLRLFCDTIQLTSPRTYCGEQLLSVNQLLVDEEYTVYLVFCTRCVLDINELARLEFTEDVDSSIVIAFSLALLLIILKLPFDMD